MMDFYRETDFFSCRTTTATSDSINETDIYRDEKKKTNHKISMENSTTSDVAVLGDCLDGFCLFGVVYSVQSVYIILFSVHYINETFDRQKTENALEMMLIKIQRQKVLFGLLLLL